VLPGITFPPSNPGGSFADVKVIGSLFSETIWVVTMRYVAIFFSPSIKMQISFLLELGPYCLQSHGYESLEALNLRMGLRSQWTVSHSHACSENHRKPDIGGMTMTRG
jgi:hypothetical protein